MYLIRTLCAVLPVWWYFYVMFFGRRKCTKLKENLMNCVGQKARYVFLVREVFRDSATMQGGVGGKDRTALMLLWPHERGVSCWNLVGVLLKVLAGLVGEWVGLCPRRVCGRLCSH